MANLTIMSDKALGDNVTHFGAFLLYGRAELLIPFPFPFIYILPILNIRYYLLDKNLNSLKNIIINDKWHYHKLRISFVTFS